MASTTANHRFGHALILGAGLAGLRAAYELSRWGIPCSQIGAEWAAQRTRGLNLWQAVKNAFFGNGGRIRMLTDYFHYPRCGAGMLYEKTTDFVRAAGNSMHLDTAVETITRDRDRVNTGFPEINR